MDMSINAASNLMLQTLVGGNQVKNEKIKGKKFDDNNKDVQKGEAEIERQQLISNVNKSEPGSLVDTYA